jgi:hypothetical protein
MFHASTTIEANTLMAIWQATEGASIPLNLRKNKKPADSAEPAGFVPRIGRG